MPEGRWRLSKDARRDIRGIDRYTREEWGREQADRYVESLDAAFDRLVEYPDLGRERLAVGAGVRIFPVERHVVVYRVEAKTVVILRVLHQRMDLLKELG